MPQTATKKVTISLPRDLLGFADTMAAELKTTRSKVISDSLREMRQREQDDLAREGYRFYAREAEEFAEMSVRAMAEVLRDDPPAR